MSNAMLIEFFVTSMCSIVPAFRIVRAAWTQTLCSQQPTVWPQCGVDTQELDPASRIVRHLMQIDRGMLTAPEW